MSISIIYEMPSGINFLFLCFILSVSLSLWILFYIFTLWCVTNVMTYIAQRDSTELIITDKKNPTDWGLWFIAFKKLFYMWTTDEGNITEPYI